MPSPATTFDHIKELKELLAEPSDLVTLHDENTEWNQGCIGIRLLGVHVEVCSGRWVDIIPWARQRKKEIREQARECLGEIGLLL